MASERSRVVLIFAAVAVVAGAAGFYFIKVFRPEQMKADAQAEITEWETRWKTARDCLLGVAPASARTAEALAIRELAPDPWNPGTCTSAVGKLVRGGTNNTGIDEVEGAWDALDTAATKAAQAFALHVPSDTPASDPLPAALDALDAAHAALRTAAGMPAVKDERPALTAAVVVPISDGAEPVKELEFDAVPSAHGVVEYGHTPTHVVQVTLIAGGAPKIARLGPGSRRSVPDGSWGVAPTENALRVGAFDVEGAIAAPTEVAAAEPKVLAVIGNAADGAIVSRENDKLSIRRSHAGALANATPTPILDVIAATDVDGRAALVTMAVHDPHVHGQLLGVGGGDSDATFDRAPNESKLCLTATRAWTATLAGAAAFGGSEPPSEHPEVGGDLLGCTSDAALVHTDDGLAVCVDKTCRTARSPAGPWMASPGVVHGKLVAVGVHGGVVAVWSEAAQPTYYAMPPSLKLAMTGNTAAMAMTDGKVLDVLVHDDASFKILRVPSPK